MPLMPHTTRAAFTVLTASIYNADHEVHISNAEFLEDANNILLNPPVSGQTNVQDVLAAIDMDSGVWTPEITFDTPGDLSVVYSTQDGIYTRIGDLVVLQAAINFIPTFTTASGNMRITQQPFNVGGINPFSGYVGQSNNNITWPTGRTMLTLEVSATGDYFVVRALGDAVNPNFITAADITSGNTTQITIGCTFERA